MARIRVLLVTRSDTVADAVTSRLRDHHQFIVNKKIISNGHSDPLHDVQSRPDVVLLHYIRGYGELEHLADAAKNKRLPLIVLGPSDDPEAMRLAMRAGASDYLSQPLQQSELLSALDRIGQQLEGEASDRGQVVSVINSKGGSGASFVATNLAYALNGQKKTQVVLVDFDLQFGGLSRYLDIFPKRGLIEALDVVDDMDEISSEAYFTVHSSGLRLLAAPTDRFLVPRDAQIEQVGGLLQILQRNNDYLVADVPRRIDILSATVLEHSDQILVIVQPTLAHINDAARMIQLITKELAVPMTRLRIIINRHTKKTLIDVDDIKTALKVDQALIIPNQYQAVSESIDSGVPLMRHAKKSPIGQAIQRLQQTICGTYKEKTGPRILGRALPAFLSRN